MAQANVDMWNAYNHGLDMAEQRTSESTTPMSFRQWCEEVLKPRVLAQPDAQRKGAEPCPPQRSLAADLTDDNIDRILDAMADSFGQQLRSPILHSPGEAISSTRT